MDDTRHISDETVHLQRGIDKLNAGDASVRGELLNIACNRLMQLTGQLFREFQQWDDEATLSQKSLDEVFAGASMRLYEALHDAPLKNVRHFYQLASLHIRRELTDLCRSRGVPASGELRQLAQFHDSVDKLPGDQREVFELIWYHELTRDEVAALLGLPVVKVKRLWRSARLGLHERLQDDGASGGEETKFAGD